MFETGAKTLASNNLVLSVLNDGAVYNDRLHTGFAMLQGSSYRLSFRDIANNEAIRQREQGSKFKASDITEAASIIQSDTIEHCLEIIRDNKTGVMHAHCRRWSDKINGNRYYSVRIVVPQSNGSSKWFAIPLSYGHGSQWEYDVIDLLAKYGFIPELPKYDNGNIGYGYLSDYAEKGIIAFHDEGYGLKRNMYSGLYL